MRVCVRVCLCVILHAAYTHFRIIFCKMFAVFMILLWSLVVAHSRFPYVSFMGVNLPNHAYVNLAAVGNDIISDSGNTVSCHTDLQTCCQATQGTHRGQWYFPDGTELANSASGDDIYRGRGAQSVHLHRRNDATSPSGIYHCDIETVAVNDNDVDTITGEKVYVGLYPPNEGIYMVYTYFCILYL